MDDIPVTLSSRRLGLQTATDRRGVSGPLPCVPARDAPELSLSRDLFVG